MQLLLAPKDVQPIDFTPKDNQHGIGYSGIDSTSQMFLGAGSLAETFKPTGSEKRGIRGQVGKKLFLKQYYPAEKSTNVDGTKLMLFIKFCQMLH